MSASKLPSGAWRAVVYHEGRRLSAAKVLGLEVDSFPSKRLAEDAVSEARKKLVGQRARVLTLGEWAVAWTTDPLWQRPRTSTNRHNAYMIRAFVEAYEGRALASIGDAEVSGWLRGGKHQGQVKSLRAMFNDAASPAAGRLIVRNPWAGLGLTQSKGRADEDPPTEAEVWRMLEHARKLTNPGFTAWLTVAAWSGMRPGELDALRWDGVDFDKARIVVREQFNSSSGEFTSPKNGKRRTIILTPQAREALLELPRTTRGFCFTNFSGGHWASKARAHHWDRVRVKMDWYEVEARKSLYLATRHFFASYLWNVLELDAEDIAIQLGHEDKGDLIRRTYGHRDRERALDRVERAMARTRLRAVKDDMEQTG